MNLNKIFFLFTLFFITACSNISSQHTGITNINKNYAKQHYDCTILLNDSSLKNNECTYEQVVLHLFHKSNPKNPDIILINIKTNLNDFVPLDIIKKETICIIDHECNYRILIKGYTTLQLPDGNPVTFPKEILQEYVLKK